MATSPLIKALEGQVGGPRDGALLRFSLGNAWLGAGDPAAAAEAFRAALDFDGHYSAAWKLLGRALLDGGDADGAARAWEQGMVVAAERGDEQARREMEVFLRRLQRQAGG